MMSELSTDSRKGLLESLTTLTANLIAVAHTRLELLSLDLEEERAHLFSFLVLTLVAIFCIGFGILLATLFLIVLFWDTHRLLAVGTLTGLFLSAGATAWFVAFRKIKSKPRLFSSSMSELLKDRQHLTSD